MNKNKYDLQAKITRATGIPAYMVNRVITELAEVITDEVANGNTVNISDFGKFAPQKRAARTGRNPHLNIPVPIPPCTTVKFTPSNHFKHVVNEVTMYREKKGD